MLLFAKTVLLLRGVRGVVTLQQLLEVSTAPFQSPKSMQRVMLSRLCAKMVL
jgi:hypothetical protein